jgi:tRNA A37 threonylcarbamoyladenosine synthetase subunit TsaC/SUA5/YrdC
MYTHANIHTHNQISEYTTGTNLKKVFKMLKEVLPGPYTFIFPATNELPRMIIEHKKHTWKRKEIGVRIPDDAVLLGVLKELEHPLLVTRYLGVCVLCTYAHTCVYRRTDMQ